MKQRLSSIVIILGLITLCGLAGWYTYQLRSSVNKVEENDASRLLLGDGTAVYTTVDGNPVALESYLGRPLFVTTWASWSPLSESELITLNEIAGEYKDRGITFVAMNRKETRDQAERYLSTLPSLSNLTTLIDTTDHFYNAVEGYAMPETVVFDERGRIIHHDRNPLSKDQQRALVETILNGSTNE